VFFVKNTRFVAQFLAASQRCGVVGPSPEPYEQRPRALLLGGDTWQKIDFRKMLLS
jgi:hypothetical protein